MKMSDMLNARLRPIPAWPLYIVAVIPPLWFLYQGMTGGLGVEPIKALEHKLGELGLQALIAGLMITPLRRYTGVNLLKYRRAIGVSAFFYILLHLSVWLFLDVQIWSQIWADILKRPYITIGMLGFALLIPLALTSNNWSLRRMGAKSWRRLHRAVYVAILLGGVHYLMLVKGWQTAPMAYLAAIIVLLALRIRIRAAKSA